MIDIGCKSKSELGRALSNFHNWGFTFDGIECKSIESVLQSFKFQDIEEQKRMCGRWSNWAKKFGYKGDTWKENQILYWKGKEYPRMSKDYHRLLYRLFKTCFTQIEEARELLLKTGDEQLKHTMGKSNPRAVSYTHLTLPTN